MQLSNKNLTGNIEIPVKAKFEKCFAGPYYYFWKDNYYNLAYSPTEKQDAEHLVLRKGNNLRVFLKEEKNIKYEYEDLSKDVKGSVLSGNIIQYFKEKNLER